MKKLILTFAVMLCLAGHLYSQCTEIIVPRVMLIGDSWSAMMNTDSTFSHVLKKWGHSDKTYFTNAVLSQNGALTSDFILPVKLNEIQSQLLAHPEIDFVHLSLGGNDVLGEWHKSWNSVQIDSLLDSVTFRLNLIIDFIKVNRPDIHIVWSGYTYPNFGEIIGDLAPFQTSHPFYALWNGMGQPSFLEINSILNYYSSTMETLAANDSQLEFVKSAGILQYTFGQILNLTVPPGGTYPPQTAILPLGFPDYPSPKPSMRNYLIFKDCFHLSPEGFNDFISYQTQKYYHKALMNDQQFISEGGSRDGSVSSAGAVSSQLIMGNSMSDDFEVVLSFNTTLMPDTGVSKASLYLRRESISGTNPLIGTIELKIVSGNFGLTADVDVADYGASGNLTSSPCVFGTKNLDGGWIRVDLPLSALPYINDNNITQILLSTPGASGAVVFTNATDPEFAPVLDITYGPQSTGVYDVNPTNEISVYPNPFNDQLYIQNNFYNYNSLQLFDLPGKLVLSSDLKSNILDVSQLPSGMYLLKFISYSGNTKVQRIIKR